MSEKYILKRRVIDWKAVFLAVLFIIILLFLNIQALIYVLEVKDALYIFVAQNVATLLLLLLLFTSAEFTKIIKEEVYLKKVKEK